MSKVATSRVGTGASRMRQLGSLTCTFHDVAAAFKGSRLTRLARNLELASASPVLDGRAALMDKRAVACRSVERRNASTACAQPLGQRALWRELHLELAAEKPASLKGTNMSMGAIFNSVFASTHCRSNSLFSPT